MHMIVFLLLLFNRKFYIDIPSHLSYNNIVKYLAWSPEKDEWLKNNRNIGFNEAVSALIGDGLIDTINNPSKNFPKQQVFVIKINKYIYYVPFIEDDEKFFLKTIIPSRKALKKYLNKL